MTELKVLAGGKDQAEMHIVFVHDGECTLVCIDL